MHKPNQSLPLLDLFEFAHLPSHLQETSKPFAELARKVDDVRLAGQAEARALFEGADDLPDDVLRGEQGSRAAALLMQQTQQALDHLMAAKDAAVRASLIYARLVKLRGELDASRKAGT